MHIWAGGPQRSVRANHKRRTRMKGSSGVRLTALTGIGAVLTYVAATVLGGHLRPHYSHVSDDISKLTEAGAPHRRLLALLYGVYNLLLALFGTCLFLSSTRSRLFKIGLGLMLANCTSGVLQVTAFRRDPDGVPLTRAGKGHIAGAGISALCTVLESFAVGFAVRSDRFWRPLFGFSLATGFVIPVSGMVTAIKTVRGSKFMGLFERVTIGLSLLWVLVLSGYALIRGSRAGSVEHKGDES